MKVETCSFNRFPKTYWKLVLETVCDFVIRLGNNNDVSAAIIYYLSKKHSSRR